MKIKTLILLSLFIVYFTSITWCVYLYSSLAIMTLRSIHKNLLGEGELMRNWGYPKNLRCYKGDDFFITVSSRLGGDGTSE